jgi:hypothetical protein
MQRKWFRDRTEQNKTKQNRTEQKGTRLTQLLTNLLAAKVICFSAINEVGELTAAAADCWCCCCNPNYSRAVAMARASRIFIFCLLLIVGTEALKLRKSHARTHTAHKMHDNLSYKKMSKKFVFLGIERPGRCVDHPPHLALRVQKEYRFALTPSCVDVPCYRVHFGGVTYSLQTLSSPTDIWPIPPKTWRLQTCKGLQAGGGGFRYCCVIQNKSGNVVAIPNFVNIHPGLRGIPSRLTDLHTAARQTDRH